MTVTLPINKVQLIEKECFKLLNKSKCTILEMARLVGLLVPTFPGVEVGKLHYRVLERNKIFALKRNRHDYGGWMDITSNMRSQILWWQENLKSQKRDINKPEFTVTLNTDASGFGWGGIYVEYHWRTGGRFSVEEPGKHSNYRELLAIFLLFGEFLQRYV